MQKKVIRLTEQELKKIVKETANYIMENDVDEGFWDKMKGLGQFSANKTQQFGQNVKNKVQQFGQNVKNKVNQFGAEANDYMQTANMKGEIQNAIQTIEKLLQNQVIVNGYTDRNGNQYKVNVNGLRMGLSSLNKALAMFNNTQQNNQNQ